MPTMLTLSHNILEITNNFFDKMSQQDIEQTSIKDLTAELLKTTRQEIELLNTVADKSSQKPLPNNLYTTQIAILLMRKENIKYIKFSKESSNAHNILAIYIKDGDKKGIYDTEEMPIERLIRECNPLIKTKDIKEVLNYLECYAEPKTPCENPNYVAVNNGIFDYENKTLMDFTPDIIFTTKTPVNYVKNPINPIIHNDTDNTDWDVESWIASLSDDEEIVNLLWEILGAIIRPLVPWNKSAWFYSTMGNNGKGTLCELMRNLCGEGFHASIPLSSFSKDFLLEPLLHASSIICDENDVGTYIDKAASLKAIITGDTIQLNRKYKQAITFRFRGFMVQCLNEYPRIKDKSESFNRRQLFIPFEKCFTGVERKYIKNEYLKRQDVLEYVLHKILNMNYYTLSEPQACKTALNEYKEFNDTVRQFWSDFKYEFVWDLLPFTFLYDLYKAWFKENVPSGSIQGRNTFITDIINAIAYDDTWCCKDKNQKIKTSNKLDKPEPIIVDYNLTNWLNPYYSGNDINKKSIVMAPKSSYRGLTRKII